MRIGCVKYLNARPLIRGWPGDVEFDHPSALCQRLANRELDVALVSSFEFLRNPIYQIVDDVSISSDGPVYSVVVSHRGEFSKIEEIQLDPASKTAANLLRCLLAELGLNARLTHGEPMRVGCESAPGRIRRGEPAGVSLPATPGAQLLIGDQAIQFRQQYASEFQFWDLGEQWKTLVGLPFVYALWLIRPEVPHAKSIAQRLRMVRDENLANLDNLITKSVAEYVDPGSQNITEFLSRYYREHLRFSFGERERQGLQGFANLCVKHGLLPRRDRAFSIV